MLVVCKFSDGNNEGFSFRREGSPETKTITTKIIINTEFGNIFGATEEKNANSKKHRNRRCGAICMNGLIWDKKMPFITERCMWNIWMIARPSVNYFKNT